ncbi:hypothetical protein ADA01nite_16710 [Aneurinibacillus danicus]|uniref:Uncharacterized protein n=1 Tax=Aneurinibacillus danicus TaxID=267746 RepID=A0A511V7S3_9BACL|nr:hypothetical protein ADA01nite_16710 [Aneurinibacillus danicus]
MLCRFSDGEAAAEPLRVEDVSEAGMMFTVNIAFYKGLSPNRAHKKGGFHIRKPPHLLLQGLNLGDSQTDKNID